MAGTLPLTLALLLNRPDPDCARAGLFSYCTLFSIVTGACAGVLGALRGSAKRSVRGDWFAMAAIALLAASLGCLRLGVMSVLGVGLGILAGTASARLQRGAT